MMDMAYGTGKNNHFKDSESRKYSSFGHVFWIVNNMGCGDVQKYMVPCAISLVPDKGFLELCLSSSVKK
jgi:hypothetical protein